ncbi:MAG: ATP-grasp domain-containing protein [Gemmataceae bacterium]|nr:ATP-grasp domain-containing protein [Gemmataceae bacterium]
MNAETMHSAKPEAFPTDTADTQRRFDELQSRLAPLFGNVFPDRLAAHTIIVIPSLTLDVDELAALSGATHYEERMLCMLMLLRMPKANVVYVTSEPISPTIIDYYLHLLPGVPVNHARRRLTLLSCNDGSSMPLSQKMLARPRLLERIKAAIPNPSAAHITCFNATDLERALALRLDVPLYACDPALNSLSTKSGGREVFRRAGVPMPPGFEHLRDTKDLIPALTELKRQRPRLRKAVVKLNEGFSGKGNAVFSYETAPDGAGLENWVRMNLPRNLSFEAGNETWEHFQHKFAAMGGIAELFLEGDMVRSPSVQCRIDPLGQINIISTHDQVLGGPSGQVFLGCTFPADTAYSREIQVAAQSVSEVLRQEGVLGRFGVDFISICTGGRWEHSALEINIRKGGTTHPYLMLQYLTDGTYDPATGLYQTATGQQRFYYASDNITDPAYVGIIPDDLIDIAVNHQLHFDGATQQGVVFHMIGAMSQYAKLGALCVGDSHARAHKYYRDVLAVLDHETGRC